MENTPSLRRQAAFCLRLSEFCSDELLANHLRFKAAEYHQRALRLEFKLPHDGLHSSQLLSVPSGSGRLATVFQK
jgi:hypothetical protein